ncbi:TlyA family RNA methyltransferase [Arsenicitalea aurantiaca]|uniref:TlyA family RNA methyltransferase n=1 Tax=Arsenicitalea aurantiaca TaxID=1783274 RepID=A0A433XAJ8_9HYPH|nr:TlyA family RNA methyltransferase [Arsenicitalea aurantiaca]RUT31117.1 TlyA family RNA methyltransferase [Arsenicitalea aurantiaca]
MERLRLDRALELRGLCPSRARARDAILRGTVSVNGQKASKPNMMVAEADRVTLDDPAARYVSRAALKLVAGLDTGAVQVAGRICLDIGASTGGFTQVLLERGAAHIHAVDVGHGQFHDTLRADPAITLHEGLNARDLTPAQIPEPVGLIVSDVSFVSVTKVLAPALALAAPGADAVILIKPQFEVGRAFVGKGGIVTDTTAIGRAIAEVIAFMAENGFAHRLSIPSPIAGGDGNRETVAVFRAAGTPQ